MAIRFDASGDNYTRTGTLPTITSWTMMGWVKFAVDRGTYCAAMTFGTNGASGAYYSMLTDSTGTAMKLWNSSSLSSTVQEMAIGTWYHLAMTCAGTGAGQFLGYSNAGTAVSHSGSATPTAVQFDIATTQPDNDYMNGCVAAVKIYSAVLTQAEIAQEMRQYLPVRTANLNGFYPLNCPTVAGNTPDYGGLANALTAAGTLAFEDGPPIPWKVGRKNMVHISGDAPPETTVRPRSLLTLGCGA